MRNTQRGFVWIVVMVIIALALIGGGTYYYLANASKNNYDEKFQILGAKGISNMLSQNQEGSNEIHKEISKRILNESGDTGERIGLARILGESNSPDALATLTQVVFTTKNLELYNSSVEQLRWMGSTNSEQQAKEMTGVAISSYINSDKRPELYYPFGWIIAKLGEPDGVKFLMDEAIKGGSTISLLNASENESAKTAMELSNVVKGRSSVSILAESLKINDINSTEFIWSGQALSSIQFKEGATALLEWTKNAPDSCAELARIWLANFRDSHSMGVMLGFDVSNFQFKSQKVREEVSKAVSNYQNSYPSLSTPSISENNNKENKKAKILKMIKDKIQNNTITIEDRVLFESEVRALDDEKITKQWNLFTTSPDLETAEKNKDILSSMLSDK
jgi:hypothetical protein